MFILAQKLETIGLREHRLTAATVLLILVFVLFCFRK